MIQVRRVNRYLIWFFHYFKIKSELGKNQSSDELLEKILLLFSVKPVIEITGPAIKSNKERNRTFYDLNSIIHREEVGVMKIDNEIVRMAPTGSLNFQRLYDGLKESDFAKMEDFLERLFAGNRTALK